MVDEFWLSFVERTGSNSASFGFESLSEVIESVSDEKTLRLLASSLKSLSEKAKDRAAFLESKRKRPW